MKHRARKRFGQNFLKSNAIIHSIVAAINPQPGQNLIEIGPGQGALTFELLSLVKNMQAIEIDRDLFQYLQQESPKYGTLDLISADALKVDFKTFGHSLRVVGNLPYNISTPLLIHLLANIEGIADMHFMLQKEVVQRLAASPGSKAYGRLSVLVQYFCDVEYLFTVPPEAFDPAPKVDSAIVRLTPHKINPYPKIDVLILQQLVAKAFSQRRKTLKNNLKGMVGADELQALGVEPSRRPETLSIEEFVKLAINWSSSVK